jgi:hypothetical protein
MDWQALEDLKESPAKMDKMGSVELLEQQYELK